MYDSVFANLLNKGIAPEQLDEIQAPAGTNINAKTHQEVVISILAEIIQEFQTKEVSFESFSAPLSAAKTEAAEDPPRPQIITNPVYGTPISLEMAKYIVEQNGAPIYFCCHGCKIKFDAEPEKYSMKG